MMSENTKPKVTTVIVNYNSQQWIERAVESILQSDYKLEVVVVDNNSSDASLDYIKTHLPNAKVISSKENLGFGNANNLGISYALKDGADFVFLQNQDLYLHKECIGRLVEVALNNKDYAIVSPVHLDGKGENLDYWFSTYLSPDRCPGYYSDLWLNKEMKEIYTTNMVNAAAWLIPKHALKDLGGFHPSFFHYGEDSNYCERVLSLDYKIGVVHDAVVYHDRLNRPQNKYESSELLILQREMMKRKAIPKSEKIFYKFILRRIFKTILLLLKFDFKKLKMAHKVNMVVLSFPFSSVEKRNKEFKKGAYSYLDFDN